MTVLGRLPDEDETRSDHAKRGQGDISQGWLDSVPFLAPTCLPYLDPRPLSRAKAPSAAPAAAVRFAVGCVSNQLKRLVGNARKPSFAVSWPSIGPKRLSGASPDFGSSVFCGSKPTRVARMASTRRGERRWLRIIACAAPPATRSRAGCSAA